MGGGRRMFGSRKKRKSQTNLKSGLSLVALVGFGFGVFARIGIRLLFGHFARDFDVVLEFLVLANHPRGLAQTAILALNLQQPVNVGQNFRIDEEFLRRYAFYIRV